ncbi:hypothetical protein KUTeg_003009 [Tegillarca granosa]|uniref:Uncharacterized protein n=1 Tax=Tegillarca granosa TaxID=220873 RepID=A0ABQ9FKV9_TEGGR|nr:hypothetical protein KUTeg_003009 [Tegillarca granosa]
MHAVFKLIRHFASQFLFADERVSTFFDFDEFRLLKDPEMPKAQNIVMIMLDKLTIYHKSAVMYHILLKD